MPGTPETSPVTANEIRGTYAELVELWSQVDALQEQIADLSGQAHNKKTELGLRVRESGLPDDESRFIAAVIFRGAETAQAMDENIETLIGIDNRIKASRGQTVLWLSSKTIHHAGWSSHERVEIKEAVHVGVLSNQASLQVGEFGKLTIPLIHEAWAEIGGRYEEPDHPLQGAWLRGVVHYRGSVEEPEISIEHPDLSKAPLYIGENEVEMAIEQTDENFRPRFVDLKDQMTVSLF